MRGTGIEAGEDPEAHWDAGGERLIPGLPRRERERRIEHELEASRARHLRLALIDDEGFHRDFLSWHRDPEEGVRRRDDREREVQAGGGDDGHRHRRACREKLRWGAGILVEGTSGDRDAKRIARW